MILNKKSFIKILSQNKDKKYDCEKKNHRKYYLLIL